MSLKEKYCTQIFNWTSAIIIIVINIMFNLKMLRKIRQAGKVILAVLNHMMTNRKYADI